MEEKIMGIIKEQLKVFHPECEELFFGFEDDLIKILPFTSFEWMVVICKIEDEFGVTLKRIDKKQLTIKEATDSIREMQK